ncbi:MAG: nucleotide exchange factor GrpE [Pseudomonadota bacterium]
MAKAKPQEDQIEEAGDATEADALDAVEDTLIDIDAEIEADDAMEALRAERDEMRDRFMRALADAENTRKRGERDRREAEQFGGLKLARDILPVYDNLSRALDAAKDSGESTEKALVEGVELTLRELLNVFKKHGIEPVQPELGDTFDPQLHQAMFEAPVPGTTAGEIIQVAAAGFMIHDRLLRPAQVGVSSTPKS